MTRSRRSRSTFNLIFAIRCTGFLRPRAARVLAAALQERYLAQPSPLAPPPPAAFDLPPPPPKPPPRPLSPPDYFNFPHHTRC